MEPLKKGKEKLYPLQKGRHFFSYRDVNRALELHKELFGVRLALKSSVKLEDSKISSLQMRDLNMRLKYAELDYHCSIATGKPGRPGNDERCPQLIRLKLNLESHSLVVYESHHHQVPTESQPTQMKVNFFQNLPKLPKADLIPDVKGFIPILPRGPASSATLEIKNPPQPANQSKEPNISSVTAVPSNLAINEDVTTDSGFSTPPLSKGAKLERTLKIRKSQVSPNEMVVVGSERDIEEQKRVNSLTDKNDPATNTENTQEPKKIVYSNKKTSFNESKMASSVPKKSVSLGGAPKSSSPIVLKQSMNMKQVFVKKSTAIPSPTPTIPKTTPNSGSNSPTVPVSTTSKSSGTNEKILNKNSSVSGANEKTLNKNSSVSGTNEKTLNKNSSVSGTNEKSHKTSNVSQFKKIAPKLQIGNTNQSSPLESNKITKPQSNGLESRPKLKPGPQPTVNGTKSPILSNNNNGPVNFPKKLKRRPGRPPDSSVAPQPMPVLSTEMEFNEKQNLTHDLLLQLLKVTSQLPMIEFSHALETIETMTDAFRLGQRVYLSIRRKHEDILKRRSAEMKSKVQPQTEPQKPHKGVNMVPQDISIPQVDGCCDMPQRDALFAPSSVETLANFESISTDSTSAVSTPPSCSSRGSPPFAEGTNTVNKKRGTPSSKSDCGFHKRRKTGTFLVQKSS